MQDLYPTRTMGEPHLLARAEPVARRAWKPGAPLTASQIDQFDRYGFLVMQNLFSEDEMKLLQAETGHLLSDPSVRFPRSMARAV